MRRLFVGNMTKEVTILDEDLGQMGLLKTLNNLLNDSLFIIHYCYYSPLVHSSFIIDD